MSSKDYIAIANVLSGDFAISNENSAKRAIWRVTLSLADVFAQDNSRFNRDKFYAAVFGTADHFAVRDSIR